MCSHAGCNDVKLAVAKIQPGRIHHLEVQIRVRRSGSGSLNLLRIDIDSCNVQIACAGNFAGRGADAASNVQVPPASLSVYTAE